MARKKVLSGQASPITVAIMTAAVIALALAVYSYFQSRAAIVEEQRLLLNMLSSYAASIDVNIIAWHSDEVVSPTVACYYIDIVNIGDIPRSYYITALPLEKTPNGYYLPTKELELIPVDQNSNMNGNNIYFYLFKDLDHDGIMEIIGHNNIVLYDGSLPKCGDIRGNSSTLENSLSVKTFKPDNIYLSPDLPGLDQLMQQIIGLESRREIPALRVYLDPGEILSLLVFIQVDDKDVEGELHPLPDTLYLAMMVNYNNKLYMATAFELPTGKP